MTLYMKLGGQRLHEDGLGWADVHTPSQALYSHPACPLCSSDQSVYRSREHSEVERGGAHARDSGAGTRH